MAPDDFDRLSLMRPTPPLAKLAPALLFAALLGVSPRAARADIPPPPDSPDAHCTPAEQCPSGVYCPYSHHPGRPPAPDEENVGQACRQDASAKGLQQRCRNGGNYSGQDLFCPKGETGSWSPPGAARSCGRCALGTGAPAPEDGAWPALALAATAILRRRPRTRKRG